MKIIIFDTETSGTNPKWNQILQLSYQVVDSLGWRLLKERDMFFPFPEDPERVSQGALDTNGLTRDVLETKEIISRREGLLEFKEDLESCQIAIGHNIDFDIRFIIQESLRENLKNEFRWPRIYDTMKRMTSYCALPPSQYSPWKYKSPKLSELGEKLGCDLSDIKLHDSSADVELTKRCFIKITDKGLYKPDDTRLFCCPQEPTASVPVRSIHIGSGWDFREILLENYRKYFGDPNDEIKDFFKTAIDTYDWSRSTSLEKMFPLNQEAMNMYSLEKKYKEEEGSFLIFSTIMHNTYQCVSSKEYRESLSDYLEGKIDLGELDKSEFKAFVKEELSIPWAVLLKNAVKKLGLDINPIDIILLISCPTMYHFEELFKKWSGRDVSKLHGISEFRDLFKRNRDYELNYKLQMKKLLWGTLE